ncbi:MAG: efflux RND transporter periplasmic adaptor subunit, partial [Verrucomicrobia bacterium]|nr:efflux RND transporter periplasmic adaptor subunit [Verrucomicrobiota bacterium]
MKLHLILTCFAASLVWGGCHAKQKTSDDSLPADSPQKNTLAAEAATARKTNITQMTGRLIWNDEVTVRIFSPVSGRVTALPTGLGQKVAAGDVLAKLDSPDYGQAQADVRKATADLVLAERNLARLKALFEHGAAAQKDWEAAEDAQAGALSEKERATARLALYGGNAEIVDQMFSLKSPIAGTLVEKNINPGQEIRADSMLGNVPGTYLPLFTVADPTRLWLILDATGVGDPIYDDLAPVYKHGIVPVKLSTATKGPLVDRLRLAVEMAQVRWPRSWPVVTDEMKRYERDV